MSRKDFKPGEIFYITVGVSSLRTQGSSGAKNAPGCALFLSLHLIMSSPRKGPLGGGNPERVTRPVAPFNLRNQCNPRNLRFRIQKKSLFFLQCLDSSPLFAYIILTDSYLSGALDALHAGQT
jgi:hypothetical protein